MKEQHKLTKFVLLGSHALCAIVLSQMGYFPHLLHVTLGSCSYTEIHKKLSLTTSEAKLLSKSTLSFPFPSWKYYSSLILKPWDCGQALRVSGLLIKVQLETQVPRVMLLAYWIPALTLSTSHAVKSVSAVN